MGQCFAWHVWVLLWIQNSIKRQFDISIIGANLNIIQPHYWTYRARLWLCFLYSIGKLAMWPPTSHPISCNLLCTMTLLLFWWFSQFFLYLWWILKPEHSHCNAMARMHTTFIFDLFFCDFRANFPHVITIFSGYGKRFSQSVWHISQERR